MIVLSHTIHNDIKAYYSSLKHNNKDLEISDWLVYFAKTIRQARLRTQSFIDVVIEKNKLYDRTRGFLNERQGKLLARMFREGPEGFTGKQVLT